ncbi:DUF2779 domain-containing protein [Lutibacter citreus]|uniref:DUF2779 domain-containing protein n=1 Tax=Lutibacter citreus TaxID=2138210 RepID=UPI000DBE69D0|nr:DUF2779 domain-containing protein [Lutibacter citreus]
MRVLTKSRFKLGLECPNKLFYSGKKSYANNKDNDSFLEVLAQGGFQVEELARMSFPGGKLLEGRDWDYEALWYKTRDLLRKDNSIIYEAALLHNGLFVRTDVIVKKGDFIELIEVKAKSFDSTEENIFVGSRGGLRSEWKTYLFDIAFQKYVMQQCFPGFEIKCFIMMADTSKTASINKLNQKFRITKTTNKRTGIKVLVKSIEELGTPVLERVDVSDIIEDIVKDVHKYQEDLLFADTIKRFKYIYEQDDYANWPTSYSACKHCEFKTSIEEKEDGLDSGFEYCFKKQHGWTEDDFNKPNIFEIGGLYYRRGIELFNEEKFFMEQLSRDAIKYKEELGKLSSTQRQWLQIEKEVNKDTSVFIDVKGLKSQMDLWVFPLHFIDFETSASALPFHKGRHPYEQIAFQFSHHIFYKDGHIEHANEFLNAEPGEFPNFEFIRALKKALEKDNGSIFRYANHENSILNVLYEQLTTSNEPDKDVLMTFIKSISHSIKSADVNWQGPSDMVDLLEMIKDYYYNPLTKGSNSIKAVLPAILETSEFLKSKYSQKLAQLELTSKNFSKNHVWLKVDGEKVISPYKNLPPIFEDWTEEDIENSMSEIESISDGGAALTAYGKLQYSDMEQKEVDEIKKSLLKYCELDTLAMVMIYEHFLELVGK